MGASAIFTFFYSTFDKITIWPLFGDITGVGFVECVHIITNVIGFASVNKKKLLYCLGFCFFFMVELRKQFIFNFSKLVVLKTLVI